jgi:putative ABC transport system permease protein
MAGEDRREPIFDRRQRSWLFRLRVRDEVDDEVAFHLEMRARHYESEGLTRDVARARARAEFGDVERVRRDCRTLGHQRDEDMRRMQYFDELRQDVLFTLRQLRAAPGFAAVALLTIALGIGATTAMFSLVRGVLLVALPYADADRLITARVSLPDYADQKAGVPALAQTGVWASNMETLTGSGEPEQVLGATMSADLFDTLGVSPLVGRTFTREDGAALHVVLSHGLWQRRFGGDRAIVGRAIELNRRRGLIVGVMPPAFEFPSREFELWTPMAFAMNGRPEQSENRALRIFRLVGRLAPGATAAQAQAQADAVATRLAQAYPTTNADITVRLDPLYERMVGESRRPLLLLLGVVALVLLIACVNVANLLLARALTREHELAIRAALGAGRGRLVRQLLTESTLLSVCGGALGVLAAGATLDTLVRLLAPIVPRVEAVRIDAGLLLFAILLATLTGVVFGLAPALSSRQRSVSLRETARGVAGDASGRRLRSWLIGVEVALAIVVLVGAGLLLRSLSALGRVDTGFVADNLLTLNVVLAGKGDEAARAAAARLVVERVAAVPGVLAAGGATGLPPQTAQRGARYEIDGVTRPDGPRPFAYFIAATPGFVRALGVRLVRGRGFDARDTAGAPLVATINESLARASFGTADPIGRRIRILNPDQSDAWRTIVGVIGDVRYQGLEDTGEAAIYTPFDQTPFLWTYLFVRTQSDPALLMRSVSQTITAADPDLVPARMRPMSTLFSEALRTRRGNAVLLTGFATLALVLAAIGIGGLVSYSVSRRTQEMAVRLALGATPGRVLALVVSQAMVPVGVGAVAGLAAAFASSRFVESLLFGVTTHDVWSFASAFALLASVSLSAAILPARRALRITPVDALRAQ